MLDCDSSICTYFRGLYRLFYYNTRLLMRPAWDSHITVIRNEEPPRKEVWERYAGKEVEFEYENSPQTDGNYWWVPVSCQELLNVRTELGLPMNPEFPLHLSIGHEGA